MFGKSKPKPPEGEVVYRRLPTDPEGRTPAAKESRLDPALLPLVAGFALLLLLILVLGNLSVRRIEDTSREAVNVGDSFAARSKILLELRVALTRLDNEARDRMGAEARREIRPPFDVRLDTARNGVLNLLPQVDHLPLSELPKWRRFRDDLAAYLEITKDNSNYVLKGFEQFRQVDTELSELGTDVAKEQTQIFQRAEALQQAATRTIRLWNVFALLAGLAVAVATTWQVSAAFARRAKAPKRPGGSANSAIKCWKAWSARLRPSIARIEFAARTLLSCASFRARRLVRRFTTRLLRLTP
jgi:hypothetical protein